MTRKQPDRRPDITPDMTLLEVVSQYRSTQDVFRGYDEQAGGCLLCEALFETVQGAAAKYHLDLDRLLDDLTRAARGEA